MIAYLEGKLTHILEESILVNVHGVGYEVICSNPYVFQTSLNKSVLVHTYHHVREDVNQLFGFKNKDEKYLFEHLISVSGIGPKSAINILSAVQVNEFIQAIEREDETYLKQFPGVGNKTARQIILDLKGKLTNYFDIDDDYEVTKDQDQEQIQETEEALKGLGYTAREIQAILPQLQQSKEKETDQLIKKALSLLAAK